MSMLQAATILACSAKPKMSMCAALENMLGTHDTVVLISHRLCNWMQGWEGEIDTIH